MRYAPKRIYTWSQDIAYSVGLMASDGCLQRDKRHIDLTSIDLEQLDNFSKAMGRNFYVGRKSNGHGDLAYRIQFSDVAYYDFLTSVGLSPAKSKTIGKLRVPEKFYPDFLRGLFDGDGSTYAYYDPRWRSSYMFYITFCSASIEFIEYIKLSNKILAGVNGGSIRTADRVYTIAYAKSDSYKIYNYMYYDKGVVSLSRKKNKLLSYMAIDGTVILKDNRASGEMVNTLA